jgi:hypothetical protein
MPPCGAPFCTTIDTVTGLAGLVVVVVALVVVVSALLVELSLLEPQPPSTATASSVAHATGNLLTVLLSGRPPWQRR